MQSLLTSSKVMRFMVDLRIEKLAKLCVDYSVDIKPYEKVSIIGSEKAYPLIKEIYKQSLLKDAYPTVLTQSDLQYTFFQNAKEHQLKHVSQIEKFIAENSDVTIDLFCEPNPKKLSNIDPSKIRIRSGSRSELMEIFFRRVKEGKLRWTGLPYPIEAQAQEASMSLEEYENFVYSSCFVDKKDPINEWKKVHQNQERICRFLNDATMIRVIGEETDLSLNVKGRKWINCSGKENMPDGEVFTGPVEDSADGSIRFSYPGIISGREVEDIKITFKNGKIVKASAAKGDDFLQQTLKIEGANQIGEFAIGTNYGITTFTKSMLFDEKMGGTLHVALGSAYPESGGKNKSAIHWDILKNMKNKSEICADDKPFYRNGKFLI